MEGDAILHELPHLLETMARAMLSGRSVADLQTGPFHDQAQQKFNAVFRLLQGLDHQLDPPDLTVEIAGMNLGFSTREFLVSPEDDSKPKVRACFRDNRWGAGRGPGIKKYLWRVDSEPTAQIMKKDGENKLTGLFGPIPPVIASEQLRVADEMIEALAPLLGAAVILENLTPSVVTGVPDSKQIRVKISKNALPRK